MIRSDGRPASARRGMVSLGRLPAAAPKPINLPSQRLENRGLDPNVEIVPKGGIGWGSPPATANAWGSGSRPSSAGPSPLAGAGQSRPGSGQTPQPPSAWGPKEPPAPASSVPAKPLGPPAPSPAAPAWGGAGLLQQRRESDLQSRLQKPEEFPQLGSEKQAGMARPQTDQDRPQADRDRPLSADMERMYNRARYDGPPQYGSPQMHPADQWRRESSPPYHGHHDSWRREGPQFPGQGPAPGRYPQMMPPGPYPPQYHGPSGPPRFGGMHGPLTGPPDNFGPRMGPPGPRPTAQMQGGPYPPHPAQFNGYQQGPGPRPHGYPPQYDPRALHDREMAMLGMGPSGPYPPQSGYHDDPRYHQMHGYDPSMRHGPPGARPSAGPDLAQPLASPGNLASFHKAPPASQLPGAPLGHVTDWASESAEQPIDYSAPVFDDEKELPGSSPQQQSIPSTESPYERHVGFHPNTSPQARAANGVSPRPGVGVQERPHHGPDGRVEPKTHEPVRILSRHTPSDLSNGPAAAQPTHQDERHVVEVDIGPTPEERERMKQQALARAQQLQKEEEERVREQRAKALAKLEELDRKAQEKTQRSSPPPADEVPPVQSPTESVLPAKPPTPQHDDAKPPQLEQHVPPPQSPTQRTPRSPSQQPPPPPSPRQPPPVAQRPSPRVAPLTQGMSIPLIQPSERTQAFTQHARQAQPVPSPTAAGSNTQASTSVQQRISSGTSQLNNESHTQMQPQQQLQPHLQPQSPQPQVSQQQQQQVPQVPPPQPQVQSHLLPLQQQPHLQPQPQQQQQQQRPRRDRGGSTGRGGGPGRDAGERERERRGFGHYQPRHLLQEHQGQHQGQQRQPPSPQPQPQQQQQQQPPLQQPSQQGPQQQQPQRHTPVQRFVPVQKPSLEQPQNAPNDGTPETSPTLGGTGARKKGPRKNGKQRRQDGDAGWTADGSAEVAKPKPTVTEQTTVAQLSPGPTSPEPAQNPGSIDTGGPGKGVSVAPQPPPGLSIPTPPGLDTQERAAKNKPRRAEMERYTPRAHHQADAGPVATQGQSPRVATPSQTQPKPATPQPELQQQAKPESSAPKSQPAQKPPSQQPLQATVPQQSPPQQVEQQRQQPPPQKSPSVAASHQPKQPQLVVTQAHEGGEQYADAFGGNRRRGRGGYAPRGRGAYAQRPRTEQEPSPSLSVKDMQPPRSSSQPSKQSPTSEQAAPSGTSSRSPSAPEPAAAAAATAAPARPAQNGPSNVRRDFSWKQRPVQSNAHGADKPQAASLQATQSSTDSGKGVTVLANKAAADDSGHVPRKRIGNGGQERRNRGGSNRNSAKGPGESAPVHAGTAALAQRAVWAVRSERTVEQATAASAAAVAGSH